MAYLSSSGQEPAGENTPATPYAAMGFARRGSFGWSIAITVAGWILLSPAALVYGGFWLMAVAMGSGSAGSGDPGFDMMTLGMVASAVCAPLLWGFALFRRSAALWVLGALASIPAIVGGIDVVTA